MILSKLDLLYNPALTRITFIGNYHGTKKTGGEAKRWMEKGERESVYELRRNKVYGYIKWERELLLFWIFYYML